jgi:TATA-binding protein-associated factor Taf7
LFCFVVFFFVTIVLKTKASVRFGANVYPGLLLDLPTISETYKMASKSRLFKSGDLAQVLLVHDPNDVDDKE